MSDLYDCLFSVKEIDKKKLVSVKILSVSKKSCQFQIFFLLRDFIENAKLNIENFIKWSGKSFMQFQNTFKEGVDGLNKIIENYLDTNSE